MDYWLSVKEQLKLERELKDLWINSSLSKTLFDFISEKLWEKNREIEMLYEETDIKSEEITNLTDNLRDKEYDIEKLKKLLKENKIEV